MQSYSSVRSAVRVVVIVTDNTHAQTHTQPDDVKTITPITDVMCKNRDSIVEIAWYSCNPYHDLAKASLEAIFSVMVLHLPLGNLIFQIWLLV